MFITLSFFIQGCKKGENKDSKSETSVSAVDGRSKEVVLPKIATRVVALVEPMVDEIYMLGAQNQLVGVPQQLYLNKDLFEFLSPLDSRLAKKEIATPTFNGRAANIESIVALQPDLVITFDKETETIAQLEQLGIPVYAVSSNSKEAILNELVGMGTLLGKKDRAEEITAFIDSEITKMSSIKIEHPKKVYYAWSKGRILSTSGKGSLIDLAIHLSGAVNACSLEMEAPNVGAETMYKWNPDLIILWNSAKEDVYELKELATLPAVVNKQVYELSPLYIYDPHTVKFVLFSKQIQHWCYPQYSDQQLQSEIKEVMNKLYNIK